MKKRQSPRVIDDFISPYRVTSGKSFNLSDIDPADTGGFKAGQKKDAADLLQEGIERLAELQDIFYANDRWGLLIIFQAMDAAGKDSTIKHVMSGVNPSGCQVYSFKQPSSEELDHDYLWRYFRCLPERGRIGIFNRSYYEEVLVVRVHPNVLATQRIPKELVTKDIWRERLEDIRALEKYLSRNGIIVLKFFLHVSSKEQKKRFLDRLEEPEKNWKFSMTDVEERRFWDDYMDAFEDAIRNTATAEAPWYVVPADNKWYTRLVVGATIVQRLESLNLKYPVVSKSIRGDLKKAREILKNDP